MSTAKRQGQRAVPEPSSAGESSRCWVRRQEPATKDCQHGSFELHNLSEELVEQVVSKAGPDDWLALALTSKVQLKMVQAACGRYCSCVTDFAARGVLYCSRPKGHICVACTGLISSVARLRWLRTELKMPWPPLVGHGEQDRETSEYTDLCAMAARHGQLDVIEWAVNAGCPWDAMTCVAAAHGGHLHIVKWVQAMGYPLLRDRIDLMPREHDFLKHQHVGLEGSLQWVPVTVAEAAATNGHLHVLKYAISHGCQWQPESPEGSGTSYTEQAAALGGHLDVLKWAKADGLLAPSGLHAAALTMALRGGHVDILEWVRSTPILVDGELPHNALRAAVRDWWFSGMRRESLEPTLFAAEWRAGALASVRLLEWLEEHGGVDLTVDSTACARAAFYGQFATLKWLRRHGCPWDERTCTYAAVGDAWRTRTWWEGALRRAGEAGDVVMSSSHGVAVLNENALATLAGSSPTCEQEDGRSSVEILAWARANGCPWNRAWLVEAVADDWSECSRGLPGRGPSPILTFLEDNGCGGEWLDGICALAADAGNVNTLRDAVALGLPWDSDECWARATAPLRHDVGEGHGEVQAWLCELTADEWYCDAACSEGCLKPTKQAAASYPCDVFQCKVCEPAFVVCSSCVRHAGLRQTRTGIRDRWPGHPCPLYPGVMKAPDPSAYPGPGASS